MSKGLVHGYKTGYVSGAVLFLLLYHCRPQVHPGGGVLEAAFLRERQPRKIDV